MEPKEKEKSERDGSLIRVGWIATAAWLVLLSLYLFWGGDRFARLMGKEPNEFGDFLAGAFAPIAFLWLAIAVLLQRQELQAQRRELEAQRKELELGTRALNLQTDELKSAVEQYQKQSEILSAQESYAKLQLAIATEAYFFDRLTYAIDDVLISGSLYQADVRNELWDRYSRGNKMQLFFYFLNRYNGTQPPGDAFDSQFAGTLAKGNIRTHNLPIAVNRFIETFEEFRNRMQPLTGGFAHKSEIHRVYEILLQLKNKHIL